MRKRAGQRDKRAGGESYPLDGQAHRLVGQVRDTKGDLYEYMLGKIASAGQNCQFRTLSHLIRLMA